MKWFTTSPDEGPECLCSWCGEPIPDPDEIDDEESLELLQGRTPAIRMFVQDTLPMVEARFHPSCLAEAIKDGQVSPLPMMP